MPNGFLMLLSGLNHVNRKGIYNRKFTDARLLSPEPPRSHFLSSRIPRKTGCRSRSSRVHSVNLTWQTRIGSTQRHRFISAASVGWPDIPGVTYTTKVMLPTPLDFGPSFRSPDASGIMDQQSQR
jgi:hypothetical protein